MLSTINQSQFMIESESDNHKIIFFPDSSKRKNYYSIHVYRHQVRAFVSPNDISEDLECIYGHLYIIEHIVFNNILTNKTMIEKKYINVKTSTDKIPSNI